MPYRDQSHEELQYVENVWTETWAQQQVNHDFRYLKDSDSFKVFQKYFRPGSRILEGGCGMGEWVRLYKSLGYSITGIDISKATVEKLKSLYPGHDFKVGNVFNLDFPKHSFDVYLSFGVIEHFENGPDEIVKEAHRVLKPGGLFCVSVPYLNSEKAKRYSGLADNRHEYQDQSHLRFYQYVMSQQELRKHLEPYGFKVLKIYETDVGHTLKTHSPLVKNIAKSTKRPNPLFKVVRPLLRKAWHTYVALQPKGNHAHMILAICQAQPTSNDQGHS